MAFEETPAERREVTVRRAPKYVPFLILGGLVGVAVAAVVAYGLPGDALEMNGTVSSARPSPGAYQNPELCSR